MSTYLQKRGEVLCISGRNPGLAAMPETDPLPVPDVTIWDVSVGKWLTSKTRGIS